MTQYRIIEIPWGPVYKPIHEAQFRADEAAPWANICTWSFFQRHDVEAAILEHQATGTVLAQ